MEKFFSEYGGVLAALAAAITGGAMSLRSLQKKWVGEGLDIKKNQVETDVVELLRREWVRAMENNAAMSAQINELHKLVNELRDEIAVLKQKVYLGQ